MGTEPSAAEMRDLPPREPSLGGDRPIDAVRPPAPRVSSSGDPARGAVPGAPPESEAGANPGTMPDVRQAEVDNLDRLSKIVIAVIPALVAALAVVGVATGSGRAHARSTGRASDRGAVAVQGQRLDGAAGRSSQPGQGGRGARGRTHLNPMSPSGVMLTRKDSSPLTGRPGSVP